MQFDTLLSRYRATLLGVAVGDALGAPFEGSLRVAPEAIEALQAEPGELRYTDDTHMTIGVAQSLIACRGFDGAHMARVFAENYQSEPWRGYGAGPPQIFQSILRGAQWDEPARRLFGGSGSFGNGAAMRVAPVALFAAKDIGQVAELARQTARITHAHELGVEGAVLQACGVSLLLQSGPGQSLHPSEFIRLLRQQVRAPAYHDALQRVEAICDDATADRIAREIGNDITAQAAVPAALCCFLRHPDSFVDAVGLAIALGGDTDTIASMTGALSGAYLGEEAILADWASRIESRSLLLELAKSLHEQAMERSKEG